MGWSENRVPQKTNGWSSFVLLELPCGVNPPFSDTPKSYEVVSHPQYHIIIHNLNTLNIHQIVCRIPWGICQSSIHLAQDQWRRLCSLAGSRPHPEFPATQGVARRPHSQAYCTANAPATVDQRSGAIPRHCDIRFWSNMVQYGPITNSKQSDRVIWCHLHVRHFHGGKWHHFISCLIELQYPFVVRNWCLKIGVGANLNHVVFRSCP